MKYTKERRTQLLMISEVSLPLCGVYIHMWWCDTVIKFIIRPSPCGKSSYYWFLRPCFFLCVDVWTLGLGLQSIRTWFTPDHITDVYWGVWGTKEGYLPYKMYGTITRVSYRAYSLTAPTEKSINAVPRDDCKTNEISVLFFRSAWAIQSDSIVIAGYSVRGKVRLMFLYAYCYKRKISLFNEGKKKNEPITVVALSKAWTIFPRSNTGIVGSNPTQGMDVCVFFLCLCCSVCR
jgi:hypothetical protein